MIASVVGALVLAALFPVYATGDWTTKADTWENARAQILASIDANMERGIGGPIDATTLTMLEQTRDGGFLFAALTASGSIVAGVTDAEGNWKSLCASAERGPTAEVACETWANEDERAYAVWVQRSESAPNGFRHDLSYTQRNPLRS